MARVKDSAAAAVLLAAAVLGAGSGAALHYAQTDARQPTSPPSVGTSGGPTSPISPTSGAPGGARIDTPFTTGATLQYGDWLAAGWSKANGAAYEGDGDYLVISCLNERASSLSGARKVVHAEFQGSQTRGGQFAIDFESVGDAKSAVGAIRQQIEGCPGRTAGSATGAIKLAERYPVTATGVSDGFAWQASRTLDGAQTNIIFVVGRTQNRVTVIEMDSITSHPWLTTRIDQLLKLAVGRLAD